MSSPRSRRKKRKTPVKDTLTEKEVAFLAKHIREDWEGVCVNLDLDIHEIEEIKADNQHSGSRTQKIKALQSCLSRLGRKQNILQLIESVLIKTGNKITFDDFLKEFGYQNPKLKKQSDEKNQKALFDASNCVIAGIPKRITPTPLQPIKEKITRSENPIELGVKAISELIKYGSNESDVRLDILLTDGATILKGVAFDTGARKFAEILRKEHWYKFRKYSLNPTDKRYEPTDFQVLLHHSTEAEEVNSSELIIPKEETFSLEMIQNDRFEKLLVSTTTVKIMEIAEPLHYENKDCYGIDMIVADVTDDMRVRNWVRKTDLENFNFEEGDLVELLCCKLDEFDGTFFLEKTWLSDIIKNEEIKDSIITKPYERKFELVDSSIDEIKDFTTNQYNVVLKRAWFKRFKKDSEFISNGCIVKNHGGVEKKGKDQFYCSKCKKDYKVAKEVVKIGGLLEDSSSGEVWVQMYTEAAKMLLGDDEYAIFSDSTTTKEERFHLLDNLKMKKFKMVVKVECSKGEKDEISRRIVVRELFKL